MKQSEPVVGVWRGEKMMISEGWYSGSIESPSTRAAKVSGSSKYGHEMYSSAIPTG